MGSCVAEPHGHSRAAFSFVELVTATLADSLRHASEESECVTLRLWRATCGTVTERCLGD